MQGVIQGNQPKGEMRIQKSYDRLPGYYGNINSNFLRLKVDGTSFPDAGSLVTTAHLTRGIVHEIKNTEKPKQIRRHKNYCPPGVFSPCLSEIGSKRKLSFGRQLLSNSVCVRKTLFVAQCPKFKA